MIGKGAPQTSDDIKLKLMRYFRFGRSFNLVATEYAQMDFVALNINHNKFIECEIKISKADLKRDEKKLKHWRYLNTENSNTPTQFYFAVPEELVDEAKIICEKINPKYGVIDISRYPFIVRSARKLHKEKLPNSMIQSVYSRLTSENINLRLRLKKWGVK
jgi:NH3-dependent NAD+ synthetase